jgi:hypothetical protein
MVIRGSVLISVNGLRLSLPCTHAALSGPRSDRFTITSSTRLTHSLRLPLLWFMVDVMLQLLARRSSLGGVLFHSVGTPARALPAPRPCGPSCWPAPPPPRSAAGAPAVRSSHSGLTLACVITDRAPWMSNVRRYGSPSLAQVPDAHLAAGAAVRGHQPQARRELAARAPAPPSPSVAASAVAPSTPMPGTSAQRERLCPSAFCSAPISASS